MKEEEKRLLLIDICGRLPYGVMVHFYGWEPKKLSEVNLNEDVYGIPYLRPMSSITEEEKEEYEVLIDCSDYTYFKTSDKVIDWLNKHHFDYRGLIEKGLAIEAPEGMYKEG